ncbi:DUF397 domain-containing protein [Streptomyces palmae]|uniref:DUF397 domain-containing protein n=1 Tax=Streptomyces palmae TaxID=1701085 RepID=A0A4Z0GBY3_9ACTN|nr:DUF397 domain-containing protein [Streptomyces palmae]TGA93750.1 DUF397 domain-containing protein [Streptomyces palmae]
MPANLEWRKSTFSSTEGDCLELAPTGPHIALRESDDPAVVLTTTPRVIGALIRAARAGAYDHLTH